MQQSVEKKAEAPAMNVVADIPRYHARTRPDYAAMIYEGRVTTYRELDRRTSQVANGLIAAGLKPQARVAFLDKNSDRFFDIYLGTAKSNTVLVGVNWRLAPPEIAYVINDAKAEALFVGQEYLPTIAKIRDQLTTVKLVAVIGGAGDGYPDFDAWQAGQSDVDPNLPISAQDTAIQLYTSGTTGHPKGVELTNDNVMRGASLIRSGAYGHWGEAEVNMVCMPAFHVAGANWGLVGLYAGATDVILREVDPTKILDGLGRYKVTKSFFVPAVILLLIQHPDCAKTDFSHLDLIGYGASPIPLELLRQGLATFKCGFVQCYGLTETTGTVVALLPQDHDPNGTPKMRSCGRPLEGTEIRILGADGEPKGPGEVGEILIKGPLVMKGYWNNPEATKKAIRDGWFYSGDAGYTDEEGYLYIYDRVKDMIVSGAENIYPAEVESALFGHPAIADVAVIGVPDAKWGEAVKAVVVLKTGASATQEEVIAFAKERIAGYKCPKTVDFVEALPRNPSGKLLKRELREPYWQGYDRRVN
jgi:acyl-CoA synthetase (AMP-forming)/AMP-acid ligase II